MHRTILCAAALAACAAPRPDSPRVVAAPPAPAVVSATAQPPQPPAPVAPRACEKLAELGSIVTVDPSLAVPPIVDPTGVAMDRFREKMARLVRGSAGDHVRVAMYGDSNMTMDYLSGEVRRVLQRRLGDGGHGFVTATKHLFYRHMDVEHGASEAGWNVFTISNNPVPDRIYGFGLVAAMSRGRGATSWVATVGDAPVGRTASRFDLFFLRKPGAGAFDVKIDGERKTTIDTSATDVAVGFERVDVPDGPHKLVLETTTSQPVRLFGVAIERTSPGVVVDSLGVTSLDVEHIAAKVDAPTIEATLARRPYDLVIVLTGTNEWYESEKHRELVRAVVERHRKTSPGVSVLVLSPPDKAMGKGATGSAFSIVRMAKEKRDAALAARAAFWDLREAMGGDGAIFEFVRRGLAGSDQRHLTEKGGAYMGDRLAYALWRDFAEWTLAHPNAGCDAR